MEDICPYYVQTLLPSIHRSPPGSPWLIVLVFGFPNGCVETQRCVGRCDLRTGRPFSGTFQTAVSVDKARSCILCGGRLAGREGFAWLAVRGLIRKQAPVVNSCEAQTAVGTIGSRGRTFHPSASSVV